MSWDQMSDYKNVAMVNNPLVYRLSLTDGQLIPGPLVAIARYAEPMDLGSGHFRMILMCNCGQLVLGAMRDSVRNNFG